MIKYYEHPYLLASSFNDFQKDFYKKYIINQIGNDKHKYHFDTFENRNGFFLGYKPHCVDIFIDEDRKEAIINNFSYFTNFTRKDGTRHLMETTIRLIKENYKNVNVIKLVDNSTINCGINKFPFYTYMILFYGQTYYMKYGFLPENKSRDLSIVVSKIKEKTIKIENIIEFTENNSFPKEKNEDFIKVCKKIIRKNNKLQHFLEEIKFIKSLGKNGCNYFFSFIQYIYALFFPSFNFFQETYIKQI
jgi:hypothetical protein